MELQYFANTFIYADRANYQMDSIRQPSAITYGHMDGYAGSIAMLIYWSSEWIAPLVLRSTLELTRAASQSETEPINSIEVSA